MAVAFIQRLVAGLPFIFFGKLKHVVRLSRRELLAALDGAPSLLNNGYLHIERAIELVRHLNLPAEAAIVDVGAAEGHTASMLANAFPAAPVYCFEPIPTAYRTLKAKAASHPQLVARNMGLASSPGEGTLFLTHRITSSSLLRPTEQIQDSYLAANIRTDGEQSIALSTLDDELAAVGPINLMKLDVQGSELEVLRGGPSTLARTSIILIEMQNHEIYESAPRYFDVDAFLRAAGFRLFSMIPSIVRNRKMYEWDAIYVNAQIARGYDT